MVQNSAHWHFYINNTITFFNFPTSFHLASLSIVFQSSTSVSPLIGSLHHHDLRLLVRPCSRDRKWHGCAKIQTASVKKTEVAIFFQPLTLMKLRFYNGEIKQNNNKTKTKRTYDKLRTDLIWRFACFNINWVARLPIITCSSHWIINEAIELYLARALCVSIGCIWTDSRQWGRCKFSYLNQTSDGTLDQELGAEEIVVLAIQEMWLRL